MSVHVSKHEEPHSRGHPKASAERAVCCFQEWVMDHWNPLGFNIVKTGSTSGGYDFAR